MAGPLACGGAAEERVVVELEVEVDVDVGVKVEVEVDVGVELVEVELEVLEVLDVLEVVDVVVEEVESGSSTEVVLGVVATTPGRQLSVSDAITPVSGSDNEDMVVSAGASTVNVYVCPPSRVTLIVHESATAEGNPTVAMAASIVPVSTSATHSFRLLDTTGYLLLPSRVRNSPAPRPRGASEGRY